jgi:methionyl aminopeptidase
MYTSSYRHPKQQAETASAVTIYTPEDFVGMRAAGRLAAACLDMLVAEVKAGVATDYLDQLARTFTFDHGAQPATLFYRGYRHSSCISINHVVCHGIPSVRVLREGDILNIDVTLIVDGWHGDTSRMYAVPPVKRRDEILMDVTYEAMMLGIQTIKPGSTLGHLGHAIQKRAEKDRMSIVREFCGHGVGRVFHEPPNVLHYGKPGEGEVLKQGMIFTVEPMVNAGGAATKVLADGWTAVTKDKQSSAQFEHTVGVTADGVEIFTLSPDGLDQPHRLASQPKA